jgi:hypothetical protein
MAIPPQTKGDLRGKSETRYLFRKTSTENQSMAKIALKISGNIKCSEP